MNVLIDSKSCYVPKPLRSFFDKPYLDLSKKEQIEMTAHYFGRFLTLPDSRPLPPPKLEEQRIRPIKAKNLEPKVAIVKVGTVQFFLDFRMSIGELIKVILSDERFKDSIAKKNSAQIVKTELDGFDPNLFTSINNFHIFVDFVRECIALPSYRAYNLTIESTHTINRGYTVYNGVRSNVWAHLKDQLSGSCLFSRVKFKSFLKDCDTLGKFDQYLVLREDIKYVR